MKELVTIMTRKGQITVPAEVRRMLNLKQGDKVVVLLPDDEGTAVTLRRYSSVAERTFGAVKPRKRPEDFKAMRRQFEEESGLAAAQEGRYDE